MTIIDKIADFVDGYGFDDVPEPVRATAEIAFLDTIGVMLAGSREPASALPCEMVRAEAAAQLVSVVGHDLRTTVQNAALVNGASTQALDYDLSFMSGQSTAALVPGLLALGQAEGATPQELISAYVVGSEVCARLAESCPTLSSDGGWHGAGVFGSVASAAAFAKLTGQPRNVIPDVIGISVSMASGITANFGTMTKPLHAGLAARNGVMAVLLGSKGFTGSANSLDGHYGLFETFVRGLEVRRDCFDDFGAKYYLDDPGYKIKPYACGGVLHCAIEAAVDLHETYKPPVDRIKRIGVGVTEHAANRAIDSYPWSEDSSRFSPKYLIPYTFVHGAPMLAAFSEGAIEDERVRKLSQVCETVVDEEFKGIAGPGTTPGRVMVELDSGERFEKVVQVPIGAREKPMSEAQLNSKFMSCATCAVSDDDAVWLYGFLSALQSQTSLDELWPLLASEKT